MPMPRRGSLLLALLALLSLLIAAPASAESALERIARTGVLDAGTRFDSIPMAFRDEDGHLVGFSVDLLREITAALEQALGRGVTLNLVPVTSVDRVELVESGTLVIECGLTTPTWERERRVDFSLPFFENGTRILTFRQAARSLDDLAGKRIGVPRGATTGAIVRAGVPTAELVELTSMTEGVERLLRGEIDGLANIGVVLRAQIEDLRVKSEMVLLPRVGALAYESIACILPEDDSRWRDFVNGVIAGLLDGVIEYRGRYVDIYERWFGPDGRIYFPLDREIARRLANNLIWHD
jgi:polar amino acid transport system substrate-binding protein